MNTHRYCDVYDAYNWSYRPSCKAALQTCGECNWPVDSAKDDLKKNWDGIPLYQEFPEDVALKIHQHFLHTLAEEFEKMGLYDIQNNSDG